MNTILITGASSGIGQASALYFAKEGWNVIAGMRHPQEDRKLSDIENIHKIKLDITKQEDIDHTYDYVMEHGGLDVLYNNAGISVKGGLESIPSEAIHSVFETDLFGPIALMQKFIPYFKNKESGVILATSSLSGLISFPYDGIYAGAKRALEGVMESIYYEMLPYHVKVKTIVPGPVNTSLKMQTYTSQTNLKPAKNLSKILIPDFNAFPEASDVAKVVYEAATSETNQFEYIVGSVANELLAQRQSEGLESFKDSLAEKIYKQ